MTLKPKKESTEKDSLHPRNRHRARYNFQELINSSRELAPFVALNKYGDESIDFANPKAVKTLNKALLKYFYGIDYWDIPQNYLCPPIPGRADYIHYMADLLGSSNGGIIPQGSSVKALDIGVGANCVYPIIGTQEYGWHFVGSDIDPVAINSTKKIIASNSSLVNAIECRLQTNPANIFKDIVKPGELFDISICNPPFHLSLAEATAGTRRKLKNLGTSKTTKPILNFGGQNAELWCEGGEYEFVRKMIEQSAQMPINCFWYSTLISKSSNLNGVYKMLERVGASDIKTINMAQGQKVSRIVAWTFLNEAQQTEWRTRRWANQ